MKKHESAHTPHGHGHGHAHAAPAATPQDAPTATPQDAPTTRGISPAELVDADVQVDGRLWGYKVILNQPAVDRLEDFLDTIDSKLKKYFKGEISKAIVALINLKKFRLRHVSARNGNNGCQMVSPWICPFALTVVRPKNATADLSLYSAVLDPQAGWGEESPFTDIESATGPALCQHDGRLFCVYRGVGDDQNLYWMEYTTNTGWNDAPSPPPEGDTTPPPRRFPHHLTEGVPNLVEYKGKLYCLIKGQRGDNNLYYCTYNDTTRNWNDAVQIVNTGNNVAHSWNGAAGAVLGDKLHIFYRHTDNNSNVYQLAYDVDKNVWSPYPFSGQSQDTPGVAFFNGRLHVIYRGDASAGHLHHAHSTDGNSWASGQMDAASDQGPALAVHGGQMYLIYKGKDSNGELWYRIHTGAAWTANTKIADHYAGDNPTAASYEDPQDVAANYEDPSHAGARLFIAYRGK